MKLDDISAQDLIAMARQAGPRNLYLISDGEDVIVSPFVKPGWFKVVVKVKPAEQVREGMRCAA